MVDWTIQAEQAEELPYDIFDDHYYWVLTDLDGYFLNEVIAEKSKTVDEIRQYFDKGKYPRNGTVLQTYRYGEYRPKYRPCVLLTETGLNSLSTLTG